MSGVRNLFPKTFLMPAIRKYKSAKEKKDELYKSIMEKGQQALKPCDFCVQNGHECKLATEKSGICGRCVRGNNRGKCNAVPCRLFW